MFPFDKECCDEMSDGAGLESNSSPDFEDSIEIDGSNDKLPVSISTGMIASLEKRDLLNLFLGGSLGGTWAGWCPTEGRIILLTVSTEHVSVISAFDILESSKLVGCSIVLCKRSGLHSLEWHLFVSADDGLVSGKTEFSGYGSIVFM